MIISLLNQKGGVGKSTTASNLIYYLKSKKYKVLGIDIDAQGNLSKLFNANNSDDTLTIMDLLVGKAKIEEVIQSTSSGDIIPANKNLQVALMQIATNPDFFFVLKEITESVSDYDFIVIDCPPTMNIITTSALVASDYVLIPSEMEYLSLNGVTELETAIRSVTKRTNPNLKIAGILLTKYDSRKRLTKSMEALFERQADDIFTAKILPIKIRNSVDIPTGQALRKTIFEYKPTSKSAEDYKALCEYVIKLKKKEK